MKKIVALSIFLAFFLAMIPINEVHASEETIKEEELIGIYQQHRTVDSVAEVLQLYSQTLQEWFKPFKQQTVMSTGTNGRLDRVLEKLNNGEHVIVVANGGSITEGSGSTHEAFSYADRFVQGLKDRYPNAEIEYLNVGISAQSSGIGIMAYDKDVTLTLGNRVPDLVLIDYAVNDAVDPTGGAGYESMVRKALERGETAVMLVFAEFQSRYNKQDTYSAIGNYYGLPMMSIKNALDNALASGLVTDAQYFYDPLHPTDYGHYLMSEGLLEIIDQKQAEILVTGATPIAPLPTGCVFSTAFTHMNFLNCQYEVVWHEDGTAEFAMGTSEGTRLQKGDFWDIDNELRASRRFDNYPFLFNFMHDSDMGNSPLIVTTECKSILLNYKTSSDPEFGQIIVYLDGEVLCFINGYEGGGYNNSNLAVLFNSNEVSQHTIAIYMAGGSENKKFTIYGMAFGK